MFEYCRRVNVYETDLMGIVHHSNYLRFCEEARVHWCRLIQEQSQINISIMNLAVYESRLKYVKPLRYDDLFKVLVQVRAEGIRLIFQYKIFCGDELKCLAETIHCSLDENLRVKRMPLPILKIVEKYLWTETWL